MEIFEDYFRALWKEAKASGVTEADIQKEIAAHRKEKYANKSKTK